MTDLTHRNLRNGVMQKDILFKADDFVFSFRVGGILIQNDKILLQKLQDDGHAIIGGHVSSMETTRETLKREYREELHTDIVVDDLLAVGEVFIPWGNKPCHQVCFYYKVHLCDEINIPLDGVFHGYDELDNQRFDLDFCWVSLNELKNGLKIYPLDLMPIILDDKKEISHFVYKEL